MTEIRMPSAGQTTDDAVVMSVRVRVGDTVKRGDVIAEVETDKAVLPVESYAAGTVIAVPVEEGASVTAGTVLAVLGKEGETYAGPQAGTPADAKEGGAPHAEGPAAPALPPRPEYLPIVKGSAPKAEAPKAEAAPASAPAAERKTYGYPAMPGAKMLAKSRGIPLSEIPAANGAFLKRSDVENWTPAVPAEDGTGYTVLPMSRMRKIINRRMLESSQNIPVWQCTVSVDMRALIALRDAFLEREQVKLSYNDLMAKAIAVAARKFPLVNTRYENEEIRQYSHTNVGLAVAQDEGLVVPVAKAVDTMDLKTISAEFRRLVKAARENRVLPDDMGCGSITISNLGMFDVEQFTAIVNPPESCILSVGSIITTPVWNGASFEPVPKMRITGSFDHRVIDGAYGARFLKELRTLMEQPALMLI